MPGAGAAIGAAIGKAGTGSTSRSRSMNDYVHVLSRPWMGYEVGTFKTGQLINSATARRNMGSSSTAVDQAQSALAVSSVDSNTDYIFNFHYNPNQIVMNTQVNLSSDPSPQDQFAPANFSESCSFSLLINRIPDAVYTTNASIKQYGTLYDLYFFYQVINGKAYTGTNFPGVNDKNTLSNLLDAASGVQAYPPTDVGYLVAEPITAWFGSTLRFRGFVTAVNVTHQKFVNTMVGGRQYNMVPVYTELDITMQRVIALDASNADANTGNTGN